MIFSVDYLILNKDAYEAEGKAVPTLIVCDDFDTALKLARKYETQHTSLLEIKPNVSHNNIVVARGYKGLASSEKEAS